MPIIDYMVADARRLIRRCENDLHRKLAQGERRDLLKDNTTWHSDMIADVVWTIQQEDSES